MAVNPREQGIVRGWCPDAWRPMMAGDGLLVRVKPRLGRMSVAQAGGLCKAALAFGSGLLDVTRRGNFQIRGVAEARWPALLDYLVSHRLVDDDGERESRRNILVAPEWEADDDTVRIANELLGRLAEFPALPGKFLFVIDARPAPVLAGEPGDLRVEREPGGGLILRAEGRPDGVKLAAGEAVDALLEVAQWFVASGGVTARRMALHEARLPDWAAGDTPPMPALAPMVPGQRTSGVAYGLPFGRIDATTLLRLMESPGTQGLRLTPWRLILVEGASLTEFPGICTDPAEPLMRIDACPGSSGCPQATVETRTLARLIGPVVPGRLHVSGCAKGCASSRPADVMLTGRDGRYDLAFNARADAKPLHRGLDSTEVLSRLGVV